MVGADPVVGVVDVEGARVSTSGVENPCGKTTGMPLTLTVASAGAPSETSMELVALITCGDPGWIEPAKSCAPPFDAVTIVQHGPVVALIVTSKLDPGIA